ncbi:Hypothetical protein R9X50_00794000 [Acrodontium crateriforme]|uniref:DUF8035 domain-containing protein n=1 Tax=Acrodontium crateriforme TaxID=150365 RepID=A0AAQ3RCL4_9PEZI|nr:Hypothetical protein R9X50_00794000 [Acrodontium crateriforme]
MSRYSDRYDDRDSDYRPSRRYREDDDELEIDINRTRDGRRNETIVKERERDRDTVISKSRRSDRGPRLPDILREDYDQNSGSGALIVKEVIKEDRRDDDSYVRARNRPRPEERVEKEEIIIRERSRDPRPPYPQSEISEREEIVYRDRDRARSRPPANRHRSEEEIDIKIKRSERDSNPPPPRSEAPSRVEYRERDIEIRETDIEETRSRGGDRRRPPPREIDKEEIIIREDRRGPLRHEVDKEELIIREERRGPPRRERDEEEIIIREDRRGPARREVDEEIIIRESDRRRDRSRRGYRERDVTEEIEIRERSSAPRQRADSRGILVGKEREEWIVRKPRNEPPPPRDFEKEEIIIRRKERSPSPEPPPPPKPYKKEEIVIRRKERSPSPEPPRDYEKEQIIIRRTERSPSPEPRAPTPPPIVRPPIIQEIITHHHHIDHGFVRAKSLSPPPPPPPPSPPKEDNLEIEIRRKGMRNGKPYDEDIIFEQDLNELKERSVSRGPAPRRSSNQRSVSMTERRRSPSQRRRYDDDTVAEEADYYNRRAVSRGYPGEAWNGATRDWGLVDIPPGTERVRMDGQGGGREEITWDRYNGARRGRFTTGDRTYGPDYNAPSPPRNERIEETKITERRIVEETSHGKSRDKMWTEITKDLVLKEAIVEMGYSFEETDQFFYVVEYLRYEDVLRLVQLTEDIRRERRERIRELQWEREERERLAAPKLLPAPPLPGAFPPPPPPMPPGYEEKIYEREYIIDRDKRRYR